MLADILIVDSKNDLNVYKGLGDDGEKVSCCGAKPASSCRSGEIFSGTDPSMLSAEHADIDFNEWAGECFLGCSDNELLILRFYRPGSYHIYALKS